jgi:hypothetical protein
MSTAELSADPRTRDGHRPRRGDCQRSAAGAYRATVASIRGD